ncbi:MAG: hypothetical protein KI792_05120 [Alphaproteobacteria bacterium]|nr:hypothetical protein [Alphaproteobacteria bacterium SS10]
MIHKAKKVVIITEKIIAEQVSKLIEECGGSGHTVVAAGGKGSRGIRRADRANVIGDFANVKFEVITDSQEVAEAIATKTADTFFENYSGITYIENVEILRPHKFQPEAEGEE